MSANVYFKDEIRQYPRFSSTPYPDGSGNKMIAAGLNLFSEGGRLHSIGDNTPFELLKFVDYYSSYEWVSAERTRRETGVYTHEDATAEVELRHDGKKTNYHLKMKAKKKESLDALLHLIKTGAIRPIESYEGQQQGMSRAKLEAELERLRQSGNPELESLRADLRNLRRQLEKEGWPLCFKATVVAKLTVLLNR